jgi:hypothetical protein
MKNIDEQNIIFLVLIAYIDVIAQQNPHYTQYMYNMNLLILHMPVQKHFFWCCKSSG